MPISFPFLAAANATGKKSKGRFKRPVWVPPAFVGQQQTVWGSNGTTTTAYYQHETLDNAFLIEAEVVWLSTTGEQNFVGERYGDRSRIGLQSGNLVARFDNGTVYNSNFKPDQGRFYNIKLERVDSGEVTFYIDNNPRPSVTNREPFTYNQLMGDGVGTTFNGVVRNLSVSRNDPVPDQVTYGSQFLNTPTLGGNGWIQFDATTFGYNSTSQGTITYPVPAGRFYQVDIDYQHISGEGTLIISSGTAQTRLLKDGQPQSAFIWAETSSLVFSCDSSTQNQLTLAMTNIRQVTSVPETVTKSVSILNGDYNNTVGTPVSGEEWWQQPANSNGTLAIGDEVASHNGVIHENITYLVGFSSGDANTLLDVYIGNNLAGRIGIDDQVIAHTRTVENGANRISFRIVDPALVFTSMPSIIRLNGQGHLIDPTSVTLNEQEDGTWQI